VHSVSKLCYQSSFAIRIILSNTNRLRNVTCRPKNCHSGANRFSGKNQEYETAFTVVLTLISDSSTTARLSHYSNGPALEVECCEFSANNENQIRVVRKTSSGWHWLKTSAYCLMDPDIDISSYIKGCIPLAVNEACRRQGAIGYFFNLACSYYDVSILSRFPGHMLIYLGANHISLPHDVHNPPSDEDRVALLWP